MATFKKTATGYRITDDSGHTVNLSIEQSYDLLSVLYNQRDQLFALVHDLPGDPWLADTEDRREEVPEGYTNYARATFLEIKRCDHCHKEVDKLYDLTPVELSDGIATLRVCEECYEDTAHELEADGYSLDLGM